MKRTSLYFILGALLTIAPMVSAQKAESKLQSPATARVEKNISIFNDVFRQLDINYTDTLNYDLLTKVAIREMLRQVDPYTVYVPQEETDEFKHMMTGKYGGIGAMIMQKDGGVYVSDPYEGLPAQRHDVRAGDRIVAVDGVNCKDKTTSEVSNMLRGKPTTMVRLELEREGEKKHIELELQREEIKLPTVSYYAMLTDEVGYIAFDEFTENSAREFKRALDDLCQAQGCKKLIIDLRGNGGGLVSEALSIVSNFVPKGTEVVSMRGKLESSYRSYKTTMQPTYADLPIVVLVDDNSASASEITCGALQDLKRATLIGEKTYGKGLVQNIRDVNYGGQLKVTTARYYLPSGRCIQGTGVEPDITIADSQKVNICYELYQKNMFFDFATKYFYQHPTLSAPDKRLDQEFPVNDTLLAAFEAFLGEKNFTYETETSKYLADLLKFAEQEDLDPAMMEDLKAMKERMTTSYHEALWKNKEQVLYYLEAEIVSRYYYQRGRTTIRLRQDEYVARAIEFFKEGK